MPTLRNDWLFQPATGSRLFPANGFREACLNETAALPPPESSCTAILCAAQPDAPPPFGPVVAPRLCLQRLAVP